MKINITGKNLKSIHANVSMELIDEITEFHNKGNIILDKNFAGQIQPHTLSLDQLFSLERSDYEISPFYAEAIDCESKVDVEICRNRSASSFSEEKILFSTLKTLLKNAFAMRDDTSRPYPSGGALYPIEVICAIYSDRIIDSPESGFYHYRPMLGLLQPIKKAAASDMRHVIYKMETKEVSAPNFTLLYVIVMGKMLVKYSYRGYRYALLEAGSMFHQADLVGKALCLNNKLYSAFNDHELTCFMQLNRRSFLPLVAQSFGI